MPKIELKTADNKIIPINFESFNELKLKIKTNSMKLGNVISVTSEYIFPAEEQKALIQIFSIICQDGCNVTLLKKSDSKSTKPVTREEKITRFIEDRTLSFNGKIYFDAKSERVKEFAGKVIDAMESFSKLQAEYADLLPKYVAKAIYESKNDKGETVKTEKNEVATMSIGLFAHTSDTFNKKVAKVQKEAKNGSNLVWTVPSK